MLDFFRIPSAAVPPAPLERFRFPPSDLRKFFSRASRIHNFPVRTAVFLAARLCRSLTRRGGRGGQPGHCRPGGHAPGGPCADGGGEVGPAAGSGPGLLLAVSAQLDPHYHPLHVPKDHRLGGDPAYPEPDSRSGLRKGPGAVNPGGHGNSPAACSRWTLSGGAAVGKKKQCPRRFGAPGALQSVGKD